MRTATFWHILSTGILCSGLGILAGYYFFSQTPPAPTNFNIREKNNTYTFTNPLLECSDLDNVSDKKIINLKIAISKLIDAKKIDNSVSTAAIYFRDLNNGPWLGIDEQEYFTPGSLLKVPLMMSIMKVAEYNPQILENKILFDGQKINVPQLIPPTHELKPDTSYSVRTLLNFMLQESNNDATVLLAKTINSKQIQDTYTELGIEPPELGNDYRVKVKTYASFFRILFNASYLTRNSSEETLRILANSTFKDGLEAGVPKGIKVAHKFGERIIKYANDTDESNTEEQLHDCGIIYHPQTPYVLCIMTRGKDIKNLMSVIKDISSLVYKTVDE